MEVKCWIWDNKQIEEKCWFITDHLKKSILKLYRILEIYVQSTCWKNLKSFVVEKYKMDTKGEYELRVLKCQGLEKANTCSQRLWWYQAKLPNSTSKQSHRVRLSQKQVNDYKHVAWASGTFTWNEEQCSNQEEPSTGMKSFLFLPTRHTGAQTANHYYQ